MKIIILTGRECKVIERRMKELNVDYLFQGAKDKLGFLVTFFEQHKIDKSEVGYIGDDLNDFLPMQLAGFIGCPADACEEIKTIAHYISNKKGGDGVIRDVISHMLKKSNKWDKAIADVYKIESIY